MRAHDHLDLVVAPGLADGGKSLWATVTNHDHHYDQSEYVTIRDLEQRIEDLRADYRRELDGLRGDLLYGLRMVETRAGYLEQQAAALERAVYSKDEAIAALERRLSERSPVRFTQRSMLLVA